MTTQEPTDGNIPASKATHFEPTTTLDGNTWDTPSSPATASVIIRASATIASLLFMVIVAFTILILVLLTKKKSKSVPNNILHMAADNETINIPGTSTSHVSQGVSELMNVRSPNRRQYEAINNPLSPGTSATHVYEGVSEQINVRSPNVRRTDTTHQADSSGFTLPVLSLEPRLATIRDWRQQEEVLVNPLYSSSKSNSNGLDVLEHESMHSSSPVENHFYGSAEDLLVVPPPPVPIPQNGDEKQNIYNDFYETTTRLRLETRLHLAGRRSYSLGNKLHGNEMSHQHFISSHLIHGSRVKTPVRAKTEGTSRGGDESKMDESVPVYSVVDKSKQRGNSYNDINNHEIHSLVEQAKDVSGSFINDENKSEADEHIQVCGDIEVDKLSHGSNSSGDINSHHPALLMNKPGSAVDADELRAETMSSVQEGTIVYDKVDKHNEGDGSLEDNEEGTTPPIPPYMPDGKPEENNQLSIS